MSSSFQKLEIIPIEDRETIIEQFISFGWGRLPEYMKSFLLSTPDVFKGLPIVINFDPDEVDDDFVLEAEGDPDCAAESLMSDFDMEYQFGIKPDHISYLHRQRCFQVKGIILDQKKVMNTFQLDVRDMASVIDYKSIS